MGTWAERAMELQTSLRTALKTWGLLQKEWAWATITVQASVCLGLGLQTGARLENWDWARDCLFL